MFSQSLIAVFKGLAEFHGYVPVASVPAEQPMVPEHHEAASAADETSCCTA